MKYQKLFPELNNFESNNLLASNYRGIGPLDIVGIQTNSLKDFESVDFDELGYSRETFYYVNNLKKADILILANKNFLWEDYSKYINLNRFTEKIYKEIISKKRRTRIL